MLWAVVTWAGLVLVIALLITGEPRPPDLSEAVIMVVVGAAAVGLVGLLAHRARSRRLARGVLLAAGAGVLFGLIAGLVKLSLVDVHGLADLLTRWSLWAVLVLGAWAILTNQRAYQSTRLSVSDALPRRMTKATGLVPLMASSIGTTQACSTSGWPSMTLSISRGKMFSPPETNMSSVRPRKVWKPCASRRKTSPVS